MFRPSLELNPVLRILGELMERRRRQTKQETERARQLRMTVTRPEELLWSALRNRHVAGLKFRRQHPVGPYFIDFACVDAQLAVELDGQSHEGRQEYDTRRTLFLQSKGYRVFRVTNDDVFDDLEAVVLGIARAAGVDVIAWLHGKSEPIQKPQESG